MRAKSWKMLLLMFGAHAVGAADIKDGWQAVCIEDVSDWQLVSVEESDESPVSLTKRSTEFADDLYRKRTQEINYLAHPVVTSFCVYHAMNMTECVKFHFSILSDVKNQQDQVQSDFFSAIVDGNIERVRALAAYADLKAVCSVKLADGYENRYSPVLLAAAAHVMYTAHDERKAKPDQPHTQIVSYLLSLPEVDCNQDQPDYYSTPSLLFAIKHGCYDLFDLLLAHPQIDLRQEDKRQSALLSALHKHDEYFVQKLLERDDIDAAMMYSLNSDYSQSVYDVLQYIARDAGCKDSFYEIGTPVYVTAEDAAASLRIRTRVHQAIQKRKQTDAFHAVVHGTLEEFKNALQGFKNVNAFRKAVVDGAAVTILQRCLLEGVTHDVYRADKLQHLLIHPDIDVNQKLEDASWSSTVLQRAFFSSYAHWAIPNLLACLRINTRMMFEDDVWGRSCLDCRYITRRSLTQQFTQEQLVALFTELWARAGRLWQYRALDLKTAVVSGWKVTDEEQTAQWILAGCPQNQDEGVVFNTGS
jgi:hypothetical protein